MAEHPNAHAWQQPAADVRPALVVQNSLTRTKTPFVPASANTVRWYNCGPTVYDAAHIGHARNYVTFDAIRRIMEGHFGYAVTLVMNITDIDDKIILRARQAHLFAQYAALHGTRDAALDADLRARLDAHVRAKFGADAEWAALERAYGEARPDADEAGAKKALLFTAARRARDALADAALGAPEVLEAFRDVLQPALDAEAGATVTAHGIFAALARHWETDFMGDMAALGVRPPTVLTRVSEFVPQVVECVERILAQGYAYVVDGSVYFSVASFVGAPDTQDPVMGAVLAEAAERRGECSATHLYPRMCPWNAGNAQLEEEGEGALGVRLRGKRDARDFCLWKASKAGEPAWPSPWGPGRPGWHIECSAMAAAVAPGVLDVHSGGVDLAFPHHDNEIAQAEAYYAGSGALPAGQWVNYFMHAGHVHIEGLKMSKSLKNFVSIKDALARSSARVLRVFFLQHAWAAPLVYKEAALGAAAALDASFVQFFATTDALLRPQGDAPPCACWGAAEAAAMAAVHAAADAVHAAFCDSFDTPRVLAELQGLVGTANVYVKESGARGQDPNAYVLRAAADCVRRTLGVMGVDYSSGSAGAADDARLQTVLDAASAFREEVRATARTAGGDAKAALLAATDRVRDALLDAGVILEDQAEGRPALVKLVSPEDGRRLRAEAATAAAERAAERLAALRLREQEAAERRARAAIDPATLLLGYSAYDADGLPTHDTAGEPLSKNAQKRILKAYDEQKARHAAYLRDLGLASSVPPSE